jgi:bacteriorhodopsin
MNQNFDLNKMGLAPMTGEEMQEIDGGLNWYFVAAVVFGAVAIVLSDGAATPLVVGMAKAAAGISFTAGMLQ